MITTADNLKFGSSLADEDPEQLVNTGSVIFRREDWTNYEYINNSLYMITAVTHNKFVAIRLSTGARWRDPREYHGGLRIKDVIKYFTSSDSIKAEDLFWVGNIADCFMQLSHLPSSSRVKVIEPKQDSKDLNNNTWEKIL